MLRIALRTERERLKQKFNHWENNRGAYILPQKYRDELRRKLNIIKR